MKNNFKTTSKNKTYAIIIIISLIIGLIGGIFISENIDFSKNKVNKEIEINILNKEIDHCINQLNICQQTEDPINSNWF